ncbi:alpha/beta fold hydrolase [Parasulfitobacter algicola]|uniref:Alpha/beta hydrolase n=1 Tax=Parasulfitobacter algicola TaxID=2614809 RepID=A0ABX2IQM0_9RHOB|nr:alpha/beta hydrolase [Sulfitobacter algicola]NSX55182.1 alpha/beta hydrolase [Sulfitobacter algicola]
MNISTPLSAENGLTYLRKGHGFPLVFVHGFLGGAALWEQQLVSFSDTFDVIVPELSGYGGNTDQLSLDTIEGYADQILTFLDRLGIGRFHLVGHSMGGMIAQQMAAMAPVRIDRLVCYGTGPQGVMPNRFETIDTSKDRVRNDGAAATAHRIAATWFTEGKAAQGFPICAMMGENVSVDTALAGLTAMEGWDGRAALDQITQPTLILWGDRDRSYGWSQPEALWRGIKGSSLGVLPGCGHNAHMEKPEIFNAMIKEFLPENV